MNTLISTDPMPTLVSIFEAGFVSLMVAWTLGSVLYALPFRSLRRRLGALNHGLWFADWTVFGTEREGGVIERFLLEYRDRAREEPGAWIVAVHGRAWVWHAALWQPERHLADRLHRMGKEIAHALDNAADASALVAGCGRLIAAHLDATHPRAAGTVRDIRLTLRRSVIRMGDAAVTADGRQIDERVVLLTSSGRP